MTHSFPTRRSSERLVRTLAAADRANNAMLQESDGRWAVLGDPTEGALIVAARKAGLAADELDARFDRLAEVPFSSERKLMSRSEEHTSELQSLMRISYAVFCLKKKIHLNPP